MTSLPSLKCQPAIPHRTAVWSKLPKNPAHTHYNAEIPQTHRASGESRDWPGGLFCRTPTTVSPSRLKAWAARAFQGTRGAGADLPAEIELAGYSCHVRPPSGRDHLNTSRGVPAPRAGSPGSTAGHAFPPTRACSPHSRSAAHSLQVDYCGLALRSHPSGAVCSSMLRAASDRGNARMRPIHHARYSDNASRYPPLHESAH